MWILRAAFFSLVVFVFIKPGTNKSSVPIYIKRQLNFNDSMALSSTFSDFPSYAGVVLSLLSTRRYGVFMIPQKASIYQIVKALLSNKRYMFQLNLRAGSNVKQIEFFLEKQPGLVGAMPVLEEGELLATKYKYSYGTTRNKFIKGARYAMKKASGQLWEKYNQTSLLNLEDAIKLASIVVKEAEIPEYQPVAQVFVNRLQKKMRLQACSTINFLLNKGKILYKDTLMDSPYNTYRKAGLPPTPIGIVSKEALEAVLSISSTNKYLFFVKKAEGVHHFAENYHEHLQHQRKQGVKIKKKKAS